MNHIGCPLTKAAIINGEYVTGCKACLNTITLSADNAAAYKRREMVRDHRQDVIQRYDGDKVNPEWVRMHEDKAREAFGDQKTEDILRNN